MLSKKTINQFIRYSLNGCCAAIAHYTVLILLIELINFKPVIATMLGFCAGIITAYSLNSKYVFTENISQNNIVQIERNILKYLQNAFLQRHGSTFAKYLILAFSGIIINTSIFSFVLKTTNVHYIFAQAVAIGVVVFWNFTFCKIWVFKRRSCKN